MPNWWFFMLIDPFVQPGLLQMETIIYWVINFLFERNVKKFPQKFYEVENEICSFEIHEQYFLTRRNEKMSSQRLALKITLQNLCMEMLTTHAFTPYWKISNRSTSRTYIYIRWYPIQEKILTDIWVVSKGWLWK